MLKLCLIVVISLFNLQLGSSIKCNNGTYEVVSLSGELISCNSCGKNPLRNKCDNFKCPSGQFCVLRRIQEEPPEDCTDDYFPLKAECKTGCNKLTCPKGTTQAQKKQACKPCFNDKVLCPTNALRYLDVYGREACHACNACLTAKCTPSQKCILQQIQCVRCPCPPVASCV